MAYQTRVDLAITEDEARRMVQALSLAAERILEIERTTNGRPLTAQTELDQLNHRLRLILNYFEHQDGAARALSELRAAG